MTNKKKWVCVWCKYGQEKGVKAYVEQEKTATSTKMFTCPKCKREELLWEFFRDPAEDAE